MLAWLTKLRTLLKREPLCPERGFVVTFDDHAVRCDHPGGKSQTAPWAEIATVVIETNDTGPWGCDVWWVLLGRDAQSLCTIPQGATGEEELLARLQALPGFDNEALISAMSCCENDWFVCWVDRTQAGGSPKSASLG